MIVLFVIAIILLEFYLLINMEDELREKGDKENEKVKDREHAFLCS